MYIYYANYDDFECHSVKRAPRFGPKVTVIMRFHCIITLYLPPTSSVTLDLDSYKFPQHIVATDLRPDIVWWDEAAHKRPDIVWWDEAAHKLVLLELTIPFETSFECARERKTIKYEGILERAQHGGYRASLITLEMGSRGVINLSGFHQLKKELQVSSSDFSRLV